MEQQSNIDSYSKYFLQFILVLIFLVFFARLFELQIIKASYYKNLANNNRLRRIPLEAPRGKIIAKGGEILAESQLVQKLVVFDPVRGYTLSEVEKIGSKSDFLINTYKRVYSHGSSVANVTGYVGMVSDEELGIADANCLEKGVRKNYSKIGRDGLEKTFDCTLRGIDGEKLIEVEADGTFIRVLGSKVPQEGKDLRLTLDLPLQEFVATLLGQEKGVILVSTEKGEILALYSSPSYDPNILSNPGNSQNIEKILKSKDNPLFNRVISATYLPGSIYKPIVSIAALEEGVIDKNFRFVDSGSIVLKTNYGTYSYSNWFFTQYGKTEGEIDLTRAIARSVDTFFYKVGEMLGIDKLMEWSEIFRLSQKTGIDLPGEKTGLIPSPEWKERVKKEKWFLGNTYHMAIGQGDILVTPIGIHVALASIADGGNYCTPHLVMEEGVQSKQTCKSLNIKKENIELVKLGMKKACQSGGTGYTFFDFSKKTNVEIGCKTGTAQFGTGEKTHAWFTAFAPYDNPQFFVTVLLEGGGEGSKVAGPIARKIFDFWFERGNFKSAQ